MHDTDHYITKQQIANELLRLRDLIEEDEDLMEVAKARDIADRLQILIWDIFEDTGFPA